MCDHSIPRVTHVFSGSQEVAGRAAKCLDIQDTMAKCLAILGRSFTVQPNNGFDVDLNVTKQLCE